ncbi:MAG TPA: prepilin-type N-terminal cleavage/methylation domain-containing protein [Tepidisphaeraceae bacterium]|nr:prepilin-type N-terminal cleavage/methylation domain-containing protein [Tepidisphaeraceae bacterium]
MTAVSTFTNRKSGIARRVVRRGFTLVEILIVVIILGILAAIVIPQFTNASQDARKSNVVSQLQTLRAQIELYKLQHKDAIPKLITAGGGMWSPFTLYTDINGGTSATKTGNFIYGPYYQHSPVNPLAPAATGGNLGVAADGAVGWVYEEATGRICATGTDSTKYLVEADGSDAAAPTW